MKEETRIKATSEEVNTWQQENEPEIGLLSLKHYFLSG
jgi:hypothetical protein